MLLTQGQICGKNIAFYVPIGCVRFARYCGKRYNRHLFPYGGLSFELFGSRKPVNESSLELEPKRERKFQLPSIVIKI